MNKSELIDAISNAADLPKAAAARALDAMTDAIAASLRDGNSVSLVGFGSFKRVKRAARKGVNPATGASIKIKASKTLTFKVSKAFKDGLK